MQTSVLLRRAQKLKINLRKSVAADSKLLRWCAQAAERKIRGHENTFARPETKITDATDASLRTKLLHKCHIVN